MITFDDTNLTVAETLSWYGRHIAPGHLEEAEGSRRVSDTLETARVRVLVRSTFAPFDYQLRYHQFHSFVLLGLEAVDAAGAEEWGLLLVVPILYAV